MNYKVGDKLTVEMMSNHKQKLIKRKIEITKIIGDMIWFKYDLPYGGYREMFGFEKDLDAIVINK